MRTTLFVALLCIGCGSSSDPAPATTAPAPPTTAAPVATAAPPPTAAATTPASAASHATDGSDDRCDVDATPLAITEGDVVFATGDDRGDTQLRFARRVNGTLYALSCYCDYGLGLANMYDDVAVGTATISGTPVWIAAQSGESTVEGETDDVGVLWIFDASNMHLLGRVTADTPSWTVDGDALVVSAGRVTIRDGVLVAP